MLDTKLSVNELENIKAKWATMKSRADYEKINEYMDATAKERGIELPKPLLN